MQITVHLKENSYPIIMEPGSIHHLADYVCLDRKVLVVTDDGVPPAYAGAILAQCPNGYRVVVAQGEGAKSFPVYERISRELLRLGFTRRDCVIGVGGGVVGDLAGFAAGTYMRGIDFIGVPTTTLSQIDASIGGKTAINLDGVKNSIGVFHQPCAVLIDSDTLQTLPQRHVVNGLMEALKAGLILDAALFSLFEEDDWRANIPKIIERAIAVKQTVVEQDEKEQGLRKLLNFGHTIGHGVESVFGMKGLLHGESVAVGMLPMLEDAALRRRVEAIYARMDVRGTVEYDAQAVYEAMLHDKKSNGESITVVKVKEIGKGYLQELSFAALRELLDAPKSTL